MQRHLDGAQGLMVLKAFTKLYAMAGLRLGYLLCSDPALLGRVSSNGPPWSVSAPAQVAGIAALKDTGYARKVLELLEKERPWLMDGLLSLGLEVTGSRANYLFFRSDITDLKERLLEKGILIRSCENYRGLDAHYYRVAVRRHEENEQLLRALRAAV